MISSTPSTFTATTDSGEVIWYPVATRDAIVQPSAVDNSGDVHGGFVQYGTVLECNECHLPGRVVGECHARRSSGSPCLRGRPRARVVADFRSDVVDDCRPIGAPRDHEAVAARGDDTELDRPESGARPADSVAPEEVDIVTISPSTVISSMESLPMSAARTDVVVPDEIAFPSWSKTLTVASVPTFWAVTTTSSSTSKRQPGEIRWLLSIEREQHALEVARVGDEGYCAGPMGHCGHRSIGAGGPRWE